MLVMLLEALLIGYLPGAIIFRLPTAGRPSRAALPAEERAFLAVMLSVTLSSMLALTLGALEIYSFGRLLGTLGALCAVLAIGSAFNLRLGPTAPRPGWSLLIPVALVAVGLWLYFPPAEWVLGGRDPGVYTNEGVRIAQTGSLKTTDALVASLPPQVWGLVIPPAEAGYRQRFMGFLVEDPKAGTVIGQFPHLFPSSLAIGYGLDGLTGVRRTAGVWGILGALAVYFAGTVFFGRAAAAAGAGLLSLHVAQVWFARSPYSELPLQALIFTALYAYARLELTGGVVVTRSSEADQPPDSGGEAVPGMFWGLVAANLLGAMMFLRVDAMIVFATVAAALLLDAAVGRTIRWYFYALVGFWACAGGAYLTVFARPYLQMPIGFVQNLTPLHWLIITIGGVGGAGLLAWLRRRHTTPPAWLPLAIVLVVSIGAGYAYFLREPGGFLATHDAYALRSFTFNYFTPYLLAAALAGFALVVPRVFWTHTWFVLLVTVFCAFFFYKIRIVPEHFWIARRFLPVILPGMLLFAAAAFFADGGRLFRAGVSGGAEAPPYIPRESVSGGGQGSPLPGVGRGFSPGGQRTWLSWGRSTIGIVVIVFAAWHFFQQTRPVLAHVEYADVIPRLEALAAQIHDDDLVVIESRGASDLHVLGLPLAYIYARNVLVLATDVPAEADVMALFAWGAQRYSRVLYMGSGGSRLPNRALDAEFMLSDAIWVPEYDRSWDHVPAASRKKSFVFSVFRLVPQKALPDVTRVDVGSADELAVSQFHTREQNSELKFRWTTAESRVRLRLPANRPSALTLWMGHGGRPDSIAPAAVTVFAGKRSLGSVMVTRSEIHPYQFTVPPEIVNEAAAGDGFLVLRLETPTWNPRRELGVADDRNVGVMITRVELR